MTDARKWVVVSMMAGLSAAGPAGAFQWEPAPPESLGFDAAKLAAAVTRVGAAHTTTLLVVRHGKIAAEWYAPQYSRQRTHYTASLAKMLVGGLSLMLAMQDGRIHPDDRACQYVPAWRDDPLKSKITVRQLAMHTSGLADAEQEGKSHEELPGWMGDFWRRDPNPFLISRDHAPVLFEPGTAHQYSNPGMAMLGYCITAALKDAPEKNLRDLLRVRIMEPLGIPANEWSIGYGRAYQLDGLQLYAPWGGGAFSPNALARIGQLLLQNGQWEGRQIIRPDILAEATRWVGAPPLEPGAFRPVPGLGLWLNANGILDTAPLDLFGGAGAGNQLLLVMPSLDLVIVRNGANLSPAGFWEGVDQELVRPLLAALSDPPYPMSHVVRKVTFAPATEILRDAIGADNWPLTWGEDDAIYTAWGDGWGFEPKTEIKLSLGFARITGMPPALHGENIRSTTGERVGDGKKGEKASGMVMVDGVLYMLVRNTGNSQLAWSADRGRTWEWGFKFEESFGCPCLLNFGRNYEGARDDYVYAYSSDGPSAYESYDQMVLARAPKTRLREREAWEFFAGFDESGNPKWSPRVADRAGIFRYPAHCQRADVAYHPALGRYLMALGFNHSGGWGIFEAPQPWGPWRTAFFTDRWDLGDTHGYRLPTKWMSADGKELWVVFSGVHSDRPENNYDAFCVRRAEITR